MTKKRIRSFTNAQKDNWKKRKKIINGTFAPSEERQHLPTSSSSSSTLTTITPTTTIIQQSSPHTPSSVPLSLPSSLMEEEMIYFSRVTKKKDENLEALVKNNNFSSLSSSERIDFAKSEAPILFKTILELTVSPNLRRRINSNKRSIEEIDSLIYDDVADFTSVKLAFSRFFMETDLLETSLDQVSLLLEQIWQDIYQEKENLDAQVCRKQLFTANLCNFILTERMNGSLATSTTVENGLNLSLNGTSRSGLNFLSKNSLAVSPSSIHRLEILIMEQKINTIQQNIKNDIQCHGLYLIIQDNYNPLRFATRMSVGKKFTNITVSETIIAKKLELSKIFPYSPSCSTSPTSSSSSAFSDLSLSVSSALDISCYSPLNSQTLLQRGIDLPPELKDVIDPNYRNQSLNNWITLPSVNAKSSRIDDFAREMLSPVYNGIFNLSNRELLTSPDIEFIPILLKLSIHNSELRNLVITCSFWHLRKHLLENLFCDPVYSLIFFLPVIFDFFRFRENRIKEDVKERIEKLKKFVSEVKDSIQSNETQSNNPLTNSNQSNVSSNITNNSEKQQQYKKIERLMADFYHNHNDQILDLLSEINDDEEGIITGEICTLFTADEIKEICKIIKDYCDLGGRSEILSYKQLQQSKINYSRLQNIVNYVGCAWKECKEEIKAEFVSETTDFSLAFILWDFLENGLEKIAIYPFQEIILNGKGQSLLSEFKNMLGLLLHYGRFKVFNGYFPVFLNLQRYCEERKDLMEIILLNITSTNDEMVELQNAAISKSLPTNQYPTFPEIRKASILSSVKTDLKKETCKFDSYKQSSVPGFGTGEVRVEELKPTTKSGKKTSSALAVFLKNLFQFYADNSHPINNNNSHSEIIPIFTIKDMVDNGFKRSMSTFEAFLKTIKKYNPATNSLSDANNEIDLYLLFLQSRKITKEILSTVLDNEFGANLPKKILIEKVMEKFPSLPSFKEHVKATMMQIS
jgi:hypothetical protein